MLWFSCYLATNPNWIICNIYSSFCWCKNTHTGIRGQMFARHGKSTKHASQFDLKLTREKTKSNSRTYRLGFRISLRWVYRQTLRYYRRQKDIKCNHVINKRIGRISRYTKWQNRLWIADRICMTRSKLRMCNSDDVKLKPDLNRLLR